MHAMDDELRLDILAAPLLDEKPWATYAACADVENGMTFYPQNKQEEREALAICSSCAVREECLSHALETNERFGIWGGTTEKQRRRLATIG